MSTYTLIDFDNNITGLNSGDINGDKNVLISDFQESLAIQSFKRPIMSIKKIKGRVETSSGNQTFSVDYSFYYTIPWSNNTTALHKYKLYSYIGSVGESVPSTQDWKSNKSSWTINTITSQYHENPVYENQIITASLSNIPTISAFILSVLEYDNNDDIGGVSPFEKNFHLFTPVFNFSNLSLEPTDGLKLTSDALVSNDGVPDQTLAILNGVVTETTSTYNGIDGNIYVLTKKPEFSTYDLAYDVKINNETYYLIGYGVTRNTYRNSSDEIRYTDFGSFFNTVVSMKENPYTIEDNTQVKILFEKVNNSGNHYELINWSNYSLDILNSTNDENQIDSLVVVPNSNVDLDATSLENDTTWLKFYLGNSVNAVMYQK